MKYSGTKDLQNKFIIKSFNKIRTLYQCVIQTSAQEKISNLTILKILLCVFFIVNLE